MTHSSTYFWTLICFPRALKHVNLYHSFVMMSRVTCFIPRALKHVNLYHSFVMMSRVTCFIPRAYTASCASQI